MHQTNHRGHYETSTATTQNQLAYKTCRRWRELSAHPNAVKHIGVQHIKEYAVLDISGTKFGRMCWPSRVGHGHPPHQQGSPSHIQATGVRSYSPFLEEAG
jgi:hypothetical protein